LQNILLTWWPLIVAVAAGIAAWSLNSYKVAQLEKHLDSMNNNGTIHSRENIIKLDGRLSTQEKRQLTTEQNTEVLVRQVNEMSGDIKVIRALMEAKADS
jgi:hypothetical protein